MANQKETELGEVYTFVGTGKEVFEATGLKSDEVVDIIQIVEDDEEKTVK